MAEHSSSSPFQRRYPPELRERAVRMVLETSSERGERFGAVTRVAGQLGIGPESLRKWVHQAEVDGGKRTGLTTEERARMKELERENRELRRANEMAIRYTERLADEGAVTSVGSKGDSYDNALAETVNGLYKTELIRAQGPWRTADQVELATAGWVAWWNAERLHGACGDIPPAEFEAAYHHRLQASEAA